MSLYYKVRYVKLVCYRYFCRINLELQPVTNEVVRNTLRIPTERAGIWTRKPYPEMRSLTVTMVSKLMSEIRYTGILS